MTLQKGSEEITHAFAKFIKRETMKKTSYFMTKDLIATLQLET